MGYYLLDSQKQHEAKCGKKGGGGVTLIYVIPPQKSKELHKRAKHYYCIKSVPSSPTKLACENW